MKTKISKVTGSQIGAVIVPGGREIVRGQNGSGLNGFGQQTVTKAVAAIRAPNARDAHGTFKTA